jgi:hypothetical protein
LVAATEPQDGHRRRKSHALEEFAEGSKKWIIKAQREVLMARALYWSYLLLAMMLSGTCSALEIRRVAACSGVVLRLRGDFKDGDYARFKSQFRQRDAVIGLDLSSTGGDLEEGVQIATLAHQKNSASMFPTNVVPLAHLSFSRRPNAMLPNIPKLAFIPYLIIGTSKI